VKRRGAGESKRLKLGLGVTFPKQRRVADTALSARAAMLCAKDAELDQRQEGSLSTELRTKCAMEVARRRGGDGQ
jgi:hypothetical protein